MRQVAVSQRFPGTVHEAEGCWYDTRRWPAWINGLDEVERVEGEWPGVGAAVSWRSGPAGRGQVRERVVSQVPLEGQIVDYEDDTTRGRQSVSFTPADGEVEVTVALQYELKRRSILTPLIDSLFIRRAIATSLQMTLSRFGAELEDRRARAA
jgi:hypothetical protein